MPVNISMNETWQAIDRQMTKYWAQCCPVRQARQQQIFLLFSISVTELTPAQNENIDNGWYHASEIKTNDIMSMSKNGHNRTTHIYTENETVMNELQMKSCSSAGPVRTHSSSQTQC